MVHHTCILLGSNIEPETNIPRAVVLLQKQLTVSEISSVWESAAVDCCYPDYLNMALLAETTLDAKQLKEQVLRPLEASMGRVRTEDKNASRPIDLDIILFDGAMMDFDLCQYAHRAVPVSELVPTLQTDTGETLLVVAHRLALATSIQQRKDISIFLPPRS
jgi:2-amino-4-hydroxy-6-hydroxymethyldihydropteridine diphosphokinase